MNEIMINQSGLELLERIVRSCIPTFSNGGMDGKRYLKSLVQKGELVLFDDILGAMVMEKMPLKKYDLYVHIYEEAKKQKTKEIGKDFLMNFFACHPHIDRAALDIKEEGVAEVMGLEYALRDYVSHVLLPMTVLGCADGFVCAKYENRDISFDVKNLVPIPEEKEFIKVGIPVLSHYASIVSTDISVFEMRTLLKIQTTHNGFMEACETVSQKGIDHAKMMHFPWAKRIASV